MRTPPVTCYQIEAAFKLLATACTKPSAERAGYFPLSVQAFNTGYNEYLADAEGRASPDYIAREVDTHVCDMPQCFALLECWLAQNPMQSAWAGRYIVALGDYISGEASAAEFAPLRTALPISIRACLDTLWR